MDRGQRALRTTHHVLATRPVVIPDARDLQPYTSSLDTRRPNPTDAQRS
jgi:hypothetical protein